MANNRRKSAAIALAVIGVAGLSLASASTLDLAGGTLQAGTTALNDCQPTGTDVVAEMSAGTYTVANGYEAGSVTLTDIESDQLSPFRRPGQGAARHHHRRPGRHQHQPRTNAAQADDQQDRHDPGRSSR